MGFCIVHVIKWLRRLVFSASVSLCVFFIFPAGSLAGAAAPTILILNSYHPGYSWSDSIMEGIREEVARQGLKVNLVIEYLDSKLHPLDVLSTQLEALYRSKYQDARPDLIITSDNNALDFLLLRRDDVFPDIPVLFCGYNNFSEQVIAGQSDISGIVEQSRYRNTLNLVRRLHPDRKTFVSISDGTVSGQANLAAFAEAKKLHPEVSWLMLNELSREELVKRLPTLPPDSVLFHLDYYRDSQGRRLSVEESFALIKRYSDLPIYVNTDNKVGFGAVGGVITSGRLQGQAVAGMAVRVLQGEHPATIDIVKYSPEEPVFDYVALQKYGISLGQLPVSSRVINKPQSFYVRYKRWVWAAAGLVVVQALVIAWLLYSILLRRKSEQHLRRWEQIFRSAPWGLVVASLETGIILEANATFDRMAGLAEGSSRDTKACDLFVPENRDLLEKAKIGVRQGGHFNCQAALLSRDGDIALPVRIDFSVLSGAVAEPALLMNVLDISLEEAARQDRDSAWQILSQSRSVAFLWENRPGWPVEFVSDNVVNLFGYSRAEFLTGAITYTELVHPDDRERVSKEVEMYSARGDCIRFDHQPYRIITKKGKVRWVSDQSRLRRSADGKVTHYQGLVEDITTARQAEEELQHYRDELEDLVEQRTAELAQRTRKLEELNKLFVDREFRIKELRELLAQSRKETTGGGDA